MDQDQTYPTTIIGAELATWLGQARQAALAAHVPLAELDWLLETLVGLDRLALRLEQYRDRPQIPAHCTLAELQNRWQQRCQHHVPVQYLAGVVDWRQFRLRVSPAVLIPRPETESLVEEVLSAIAQSPQAEALMTGHWADLGTGSGAIAISLATELPQAHIHAVDCSPAALAIATQNAQTWGVGDRIQFYQGAWFEPLADPVQTQGILLAGMVSNPPYIPHATISTLQPEVQQHEPHLALDGGVDGLDAIRLLIQQAPKLLQPGGLWAIEVMAGQAAPVAQLVAASGHYDRIQTKPDLAGIDRFVMAQCRG